MTCHTCHLQEGNVFPAPDESWSQNFPRFRRSKKTAAFRRYEKSTPASRWWWFFREYPRPPALPCHAGIHHAVIAGASKTESGDPASAPVRDFLVKSRCPQQQGRGQDR